VIKKGRAEYRRKRPRNGILSRRARQRFVNSRGNDGHTADEWPAARGFVVKSAARTPVRLAPSIDSVGG
jgi:hypothetical protein